MTFDKLLSVILDGLVSVTIVLSAEAVSPISALDKLDTLDDNV